MWWRVPIDNTTYHLAQLDGSRLAIPIAGKIVKIFKRRQDEGPDLDDLNDENDRVEPANVSKVNAHMEDTNWSL